MAKPRIVVTRRLPREIEARMAELFDVRFSASDAPFARADLLAAMAECDALVPSLTDVLDAGLIARAGPRLRLIASYSVGVDHIDVEAAAQRGITVTNTPGALTEDTADVTLALILSVPRRLAEGMRLVREGQWRDWSPTFMLGHRVWGKSLGIIGMGRIGTAVARRARGFGMTIHYHNRRPAPADIEHALDATYWPDLDLMLPHCDIVTIHCPHTRQTHRLLDAARLDRLKPSATLINTSRGEIVAEAALIERLATGRIAGAGLDVFEHEPGVDPRLVALPNVQLLPHMGSATIEGRLAMGEQVIVNIRTFFDGHTPPGRVLKSEAVGA